MRKKSLSLLLLGSALAISLCGCGKDKDDKDEKTTVTTTEATTEYVTTEDDLTTTTEDDTTNNTTDFAPVDTNLDVLTPDEVQARLNALSTDFAKVNWAASQSPLENATGIVVSYAPYFDADGTFCMVVAVTNLYDQTVAFSGDIDITNASGEIIGNTYFVEDYIGPKNTIMRVTYSLDPEGSFNATCYNADAYVDAVGFVPYLGEWACTPTGNTYNYSYSIYSNENMYVNAIWSLILDDNGNVLATYEDLVYDYINVGETHDLSIDLPVDPNVTPVAGVAIFSNPIQE